MAVWTFVAGFIHLFISIPTVIHILLRKDDDNAAISWIGLVLLSPFLGSFIYWIFGINRVKRQAKDIKPDKGCLSLQHTDKFKNVMPERWVALMHMGRAIHHAEYLEGNRVGILKNGDEAYPAMIRAIDQAQKSIFLSSYIFDYDAAGKQFVKALCKAHERGVSVHVLIDGIGLGISWRRTDISLRRAGIKTARFFPARWFSRSRFINLRNHRKILSIDSSVAFIGGINIRAGNILLNAPRSPVQDVHFEVRGPVVDQINEVFAEDWLFAKREALEVVKSPVESAGHVIARILPDGPDANYQKLQWTLLGAVNSAKSCIRIVTPYFIPDDILLSALQAASLRGIDVEVIIPKKSNILFFNWAMRANFQKLFEFGIKLYESPAPFDHSKIFLVDDRWAFIGSSNWDARSLHLNFEINLECYDEILNAELSGIFEQKKGLSVLIQPVKYSLSRQILYNLFRLASPYL